MNFKFPWGFIRPWEAQDLPTLLRCLQQEPIRKNLRSTSAYSLSPSSSPSHFAVIYDHQTIGGIGFDFDLPHSRAYLGFWIDELYAGKGVISSAIPPLCQWFQLEHPSLIIQASVYGWNIPSQRLLEKVGFTSIAQLPQVIHYSNEITDLFIYEW